eukprot:3255223-Pyramimonas_sp.AAC.1
MMGGAVADATSDIGRGVRQGDPSSMCFFALALGYCDDLVCFSKDALGGLGHVLELLWKLEGPVGLSLNAKECALLVVGDESRAGARELMDSMGPRFRLL